MQGRKKIILVSVSERPTAVHYRAEELELTFRTQLPFSVVRFTNNIKFNDIFLIFLDSISW